MRVPLLDLRRELQALSPALLDSWSQCAVARRREYTHRGRRRVPRGEAQLAPGPYRVIVRAGERVLLRPDLLQSSNPSEQGYTCSISARETKG